MIMLDKLDSITGFHQEALNLRNVRQQILATNIANADTPNYQARDIDFRAELSKAAGLGNSISNVTLHSTSKGHINTNMGASNIGSQSILYRIPYQYSADNNTVEMDKERMEFVDNSIRYQGSLTFLGEQFKKLAAALQEG